MSNQLQAIIATWRNVNVSSLQHEMDKVANELEANQNESEASKKNLIELLREFKKNATDDTRLQIAPVLKNFQKEVDNLNKRSEFAETAFLNIFRKIIDAVDPLPTFEYCASLEKKVSRIVDLEIENKNLKKRIQENDEDIKDKKIQEKTLKTLQERVNNYENQIEERIKSRLKELEGELIRQYTEKEKVIIEREEFMKRKLSEAESQAKSLQEALNESQSELFDYKVKFEEASVAKSDEMDILINDVECLSQHSVLLEKENVSLKQQLDTFSNSVNSLVDSKGQEESGSLLKEELLSKEKENALLVDYIKKYTAELNVVKESSLSEIALLQKNLERSNAENKKLQSLLTEQSDYSEIKKELAIFKSIEFSSDLNMSEDKSSKSLEVLLLGKTKSLQNENMFLKKELQEYKSLLDKHEKVLNKLQETISNQTSVIANLEADLLSVHSLTLMYRGEDEGSAFVSDSERSNVLEESISLSSNPTPLSATNISPNFVSAAESLLPIISSQRERFRIRNEVLEAESAAKSEQIIILQNELDSLRTDNLKLYEKIRFLQSYRAEEKCDTSVTESRYVSAYETSLDPFSSFSRKERFKRYAELSPFEKVTLSLGRFILSNKTARTVAFIYAALVHCLVFLVLYKLAYTESCKRDFASDCAEKFAKHMEQVHGENDFHDFI